MATASATTMQVFRIPVASSAVNCSPPIFSRSLPLSFQYSTNRFVYTTSNHRNHLLVSRAGISSSAGNDDDDGVSLGTMKLPLNTDVVRFESLLFQWANSLCQGAMLPLPMPLKVDKIPGGARLGFIEIGDGCTTVDVYIDCLVYPPENGSGPFFRAVRNGALKNKAPPGEQRIMKSLLGALQKSVEIATA